MLRPNYWNEGLGLNYQQIIAILSVSLIGWYMKHPFYLWQPFDSKRATTGGFVVHQFIFNDSQLWEVLQSTFLVPTGSSHAFLQLFVIQLCSTSSENNNKTVCHCDISSVELDLEMTRTCQLVQVIDKSVLLTRGEGDFVVWKQQRQSLCFCHISTRGATRDKRRSGCLGYIKTKFKKKEPSGWQKWKIISIWKQLWQTLCVATSQHLFI